MSEEEVDFDDIPTVTNGSEIDVGADDLFLISTLPSNSLLNVRTIRMLRPPRERRARMVSLRLKGEVTVILNAGNSFYGFQSLPSTIAIPPQSSTSTNFTATKPFEEPSRIQRIQIKSTAESSKAKRNICEVAQNPNAEHGGHRFHRCIDPSKLPINDSSLPSITSKSVFAAPPFFKGLEMSLKMLEEEENGREELRSPVYQDALEIRVNIPIQLLPSSSHPPNFA